MSSKLTKLLTAVTAILGLVGVYFLIRIISAGDDPIKNDAELQASIVDPFVSFAKIVLILTIVIAVVSSIINILKHPEQLKRSIIGILVLGAILAAVYFTASGEAVLDVNGQVLKDGEAGPISKWVSTGITYSVVLGGIGLFFFVVDFVKSLVK